MTGMPDHEIAELLEDLAAAARDGRLEGILLVAIEDESDASEVGVHRLLDSPSIKAVAGMFAEAHNLVREAAEDVLRDGRMVQ
ncbi:hypothetical protein [Amaricoccus sp. W119]|uniref:hypothetical protein n=1 Tax=Amaricoccus sp. W119 TaxID=3391833 RepID=UPI0039A4C04E